MSTPTDVPLTAPLQSAGAAEPARASSAHKRIWLALRIVVPLLLLGYLFSITSIPDLIAALRAVPLSSAVAVAGLVLLGVLVAAWRWQITLRACGVRGRAPVLELFRLHWIGAFYSQFVPGGLGSEVVRAIATRKLFGQRGLAAALGVVLLERMLGLCGLLIVVCVTFALYPLPGVPHVVLLSSLGAVAVVGCVGATVAAPRVAPLLPGPLRRVLEAVPVIHSFGRLAIGVALSVLTQLIGVAIGHVVVTRIVPGVEITHSLVINPLILAAQFFPLSIGGAGIREMAFVGLYGLVGVPRHAALAAALVVGGIQLLTGAAGGVVQLLRPLAIDASARD